VFSSVVISVALFWCAAPGQIRIRRIAADFSVLTFFHWRSGHGSGSQVVDWRNIFNVLTLFLYWLPGSELVSDVYFP
jgi:hypothetical protein